MPGSPRSTASAVARAAHFEAMIATSAAGSFEILARTSAALATMSIRNGWIRAQRLE
jgi:hypothetical protein